MSRAAMNILLMVVFIALIYFMMIRPQRKRDKEVKDMRSSLRIGDEVVTIGGIVGKIVKIKDEVIVLQVGSDKVKLEFLKSAIGNVTKTSNAKPAQAAEKAEEEEPEKKTRSKDKKITPKKISAKKSSEEPEEKTDSEEK